MKRYSRRIAVFGMVVVMILCGICSWGNVTVEAATQVPGFNARVTENNMMKILDRYDPDGAYIIRKQKAAGDNILSWFYSGRIIDDIGTAVHEETHGYSFRGMYNGYAYYVGKEKTIKTSFTTVYQSKQMASSIPKKLRTFRYDIYVANPLSGLSSDIYGVYGLMNEFMAYRMSMNNAVSLYSYYVDKNADWDTWGVFIRECENGKLAYAEFKYYILHYLFYAKKHYPQVYKDIVKNKQFCKAYRIMESSYGRLVRVYGKDLEKMQELMEKKGHILRIEKDYVCFYESEESGGNGIGRSTADYDRLLKELKKTRYVSIHKQLVRKSK